MAQRKENLGINKKVKALASDYFALLRDEGTVSPEELAAQRENIKSRLEELDPTAIKQFMDECNSNPDMNLRIKRDINSYVRTVFITNYPFEMARMMSDAPEVFRIECNAEPGKVNQDSFNEDPFNYLIYYQAYMKKDLQSVFQCLAEYPPEFQSSALSKAVAFYAESPSQRTELLEKMRTFATTPEQRELVNGQLSELAFGRPDAKASFTEVSDWLGSANLSGEELVGATRGMQEKVQAGETAQWLDWLAKTDIPDEVSKERAFELATRWTENDYQAVGQWLNSSPNSPEKTAVAGAYAAKAYPYDPENAIRWIETLPQGPDRTKALEAIYQGMPKDSDEAKAFASENGLTE
jgi:hypothetical protein